MKKIIVIIYLLGLTFFIPLSSSPSSAQDHLDPEKSDYSSLCDEYCRNSWTHLYRDIFNKNIKARAIIRPSFRTIYAIALKDEDNHFTVLHLIAEEKYIEYLWDKNYPHDREAGVKAAPEPLKKMTRCEKNIDSELARKIQFVWKEMLLRTRYISPRDLYLDGTTYHFAYNEMAGVTKDAPSTSKRGKLIALAELLVKFCNSSSSDTKELETATQQLKKLLKN